MAIEGDGEGIQDQDVDGLQKSRCVVLLYHQ